jgi:hypothetical protein
VLAAAARSCATRAYPCGRFKDYQLRSRQDLVLLLLQADHGVKGGAAAPAAAGAGEASKPAKVAGKNNLLAL